MTSGSGSTPLRCSIGSAGKSRSRSALSRRAVLACFVAGGLAPMQSRCAGAASAERYTSPVEIKADDIAWFRACRSAWIESERGAPAVVPAGAPSRYAFCAAGLSPARAAGAGPLPDPLRRLGDKDQATLRTGDRRGNGFLFPRHGADRSADVTERSSRPEVQGGSAIVRQVALSGRLGACALRCVRHARCSRA